MCVNSYMYFQMLIFSNYCPPMLILTHNYNVLQYFERHNEPNNVQFIVE